MTTVGVCKAARMLHEHLTPEPWFQSVGIGATDDGKTCIYVYRRPGKLAPELRKIADEGWQGFRVKVSRLGTVRPA